MKNVVEIEGVVSLIIDRDEGGGRRRNWILWIW